MQGESSREAAFEGRSESESSPLSVTFAGFVALLSSSTSEIVGCTLRSETNKGLTKAAVCKILQYIIASPSRDYGTICIVQNDGEHRNKRRNRHEPICRDDVSASWTHESGILQFVSNLQQICQMACFFMILGPTWP